MTVKMKEKRGAALDAGEKAPQLGVKHGEPTLVAPVEATPTGEQYYLSNLDQYVAMIVPTVYSYKSSPSLPSGSEDVDVAATLRDALARVLVHYYPLAGRLRISPEMKLTVELTGEGVVFVEADAACDLAVVGDLTNLNPVVLGQLVYSVPGAKHILEMPLVTAQVTRFKCGGFALGLAVNHCMFDGISAMEFVNSWAETARGVAELTVAPFLDRSVLKARDPPVHIFPHHEFAEIPDVSDTASLYSSQVLLYRSFCFDPDRLERVRGLALADGALQGSCTIFEALSGLVWRARTKALGLVPEQRTKVLFAVDARRRLSPPLPRGYFGNGIMLGHALATAGELLSAPVSRAVGLVQEAVRMVTDEYVRSAVDYLEATRAQMVLASTLLLTTWSRLEFHGADFGWGEPAMSGPITVPEEGVIFLAHGKERNGINVVLGLPATAMDIFQELMDEI